MAETQSIFIHLGEPSSSLSYYWNINLYVLRVTCQVLLTQLWLKYYPLCSDNCISAIINLHSLKEFTRIADIPVAYFFQRRFILKRYLVTYLPTLNFRNKTEVIKTYIFLPNLLNSATSLYVPRWLSGPPKRPILGPESAANVSKYSQFMLISTARALYFTDNKSNKDRSVKST